MTPSQRLIEKEFALTDGVKETHKKFLTQMIVVGLVVLLIIIAI